MSAPARCARCGAPIPPGARACPLCGGGPARGPWRRLGVRARSMILGMLLALVVLGAAIAFIFARHQYDAQSADIRVTSGR